MFKGLDLIKQLKSLILLQTLPFSAVVIESDPWLHLLLLCLLPASISTVMLMVGRHACVNTWSPSPLCFSTPLSFYVTSHLTLRVFVPVQRARHSWSTSSPVHTPPQQTAEDHPCIPAPATAASGLWAGERMQSQTRITQTRESTTYEGNIGDCWPPLIKQNIEYNHCYGRREFVFMKDCTIYLIVYHVIVS